MEVAVLDTFKINVATGPYTTLDSKPQISKLNHCSISCNLKSISCSWLQVSFHLSIILRVLKFAHETCPFLPFLLYYFHLKMQMETEGTTLGRIPVTKAQHSSDC